MRKQVFFAALGLLSTVGVVIAQRLNDGGPSEVVRNYFQELQDGSVTPTRYLPKIERIISIEAQPVSLATADPGRRTHLVVYTVETSVTAEYSQSRLRWLRQQLAQENRVLRYKPEILNRTRTSIHWSMERMKAGHWIVQGIAFVDMTSRGWRVSSPEGVWTNLAAWVLDIYYEPGSHFE